jgi:hypothetical protein
MDVEASIEQVAGILVREDFNFGTAQDGRSYRLLFGSAAVFIHFESWHTDSVVITVSSPILQDIEPESPGAARAYTLLNELNRSRYFIRFTFDDGTLAADYDLLGDTLQAAELVNAIYAVAAAADHLDDALIEEIGGKKYETVLEEWDLEHDEEQA